MRAACRHQASLIAGALLANTKLPLTTWLLAMYLLSQAKTGLSALALKRQLGVSYPTAWLVHHKIMQAMAERDSTHRLEGTVQLDDAYLCGERSGGKVGRGSENKVPFVAAVSLDPRGYPAYLKLAPLPGFTLLPRLIIDIAGCSPRPQRLIRGNTAQPVVRENAKNYC